MRDPGAGTPVFTPPRPSVLTANRTKNPAALGAYLAHAHGEPSPAQVKAERVQAQQRQRAGELADQKERLAETGRSKSKTQLAQDLIGHFGEAPFAVDQRLRELGFSDQMIQAVRREHPVKNADGSEDVVTTHG